MSKSPQGVYVNEATHNRVSMLVENALDGHGTLAGFVAYLEEALSGATHDPDLLVFDRERRKSGVLEPIRDRERMRRFDDAPKDGFGVAPTDSEDAAAVARASLEAYEAAWRDLGETMPWGEADPRSHVVALYLLRGDPRLWQHDKAYDAPRVRHYTLYSELSELLDLRHPERALRYDEFEADGQEPPTLLWRDGSVEALLEPAKNRSTSFYLDPEAHDLALKAFGRDLFDRLERGLRRLLDNPRHYLQALQPHFNFLEHGPALGDYRWRDMKPEHQELMLEWLSERLAGGLWRRGSDDAPGVDEPPAVPGENNLSLAAYLGVLEDPRTLREQDSERSNLVQAFLERYRLQRLAPERDLAYQVIRGVDLPTDRTFVSNAVDYHLLKLFQAYALTVLPADQREERRVHPMTLATFAQPQLFPTRVTLEAYGGVKALKNAWGGWELVSGRKTALELSDAEAYWTAQALNAVLSTQPYRTSTQKLVDLLASSVHGDDDINPFGHIWATTVTELTGKTRIKIALGLPVVERALEGVRRAGERPDPIAVGLELTAQLTDEALRANGKFTEAFLAGCAFYLEEASA